MVARIRMFPLYRTVSLLVEAQGRPRVMFVRRAGHVGNSMTESNPDPRRRRQASGPDRLRPGRRRPGAVVSPGRPDPSSDVASEKTSYRFVELETDGICGRVVCRRRRTTRYHRPHCMISDLSITRLSIIHQIVRMKCRMISDGRQGPSIRTLYPNDASLIIAKRTFGYL